MSDQIDLKTIASIPLFATAPTDALERVQLTASLESLDVGQTLFEAGDSSREVYFILEGKIRIFFDTGGERDVTLVDFGKGGCFGELAALAGQPRTGRAQALEPTRLIKLDHLVFNDLVQKHKEISWQLILRLADQIRKIDRRAADSSLLSDNVRFCRELLRMAMPASELSTVMVVPRLPKHQELADQAKISVQAITETMAWLLTEKIIERRPESLRSLVIKDLDRLKAAAHIEDE